MCVCETDRETDGDTWLQNEFLLDVKTSASPKQHMHKHTCTSGMRFWLFSWLPNSQTSFSNCNLYWQMAMSCRARATKEEKSERGGRDGLFWPIRRADGSLQTLCFDTHLSHTHTHTHTHARKHALSHHYLKQNCSVFIVEIVSIVASLPWCWAICPNQYSLEIGILSMVYSLARSLSLRVSLLMLAWEKSDYLRKKRVSTHVVCLPSLWKDSCCPLCTSLV